MNLADELLLILGHVCQLATVPSTHIFAAGTQPDSLVLKILFLLLAQMSTVQIVTAPPIVVLLCALEIAQAQTLLGPGHVVARTMNVLQHDGLRRRFVSGY